jgi:hypothetical protein
MAMAYDAHDTAVMVRINRHIMAANQRNPNAWSKNIEERQEDPTNTIGRDADYYFAARKELAKCSNPASVVGKALLGEVAWVVYGIGKLGSEALGHPEWTRTDPDKPNAPVGGFIWMNRGSADGAADVGDHTGDVRLHVPLEGDTSKEPRPSGMRRGTT